MLVFLIMAGGSGERFWPLSTKENPKQLLKIFANKSLLRLTFERVLPISSASNIFIATNAIQLEAIKKELPEISPENIIIEPLFKDTAAAILYSSMIISKYFSDPTICVLASDHLIADENNFRNIIKEAETLASEPNIITLGIKPLYPETGYGYIEVRDINNNSFSSALCFKEKPNYETAKTYFDAKTYLWNSGIFIFKYSTIMDAANKYAKSHYEIVMEMDKLISKNEGTTTSLLVKDLFLKFEKKSIDYAIMEKAKNILVIPSSFGWNDVGSYQAFWDLYEKDSNENIVINSNTISVDSKNNLIIGKDINYRVSLLGIENQIIVCTKEELLICNKDKIQEIKKLLMKI